jgi:translation initiation factor 2-alpha kinase 4
LTVLADDLATSTGTAGLDSLVKSHPKLQSFVQDLKTVLRLAQTLGCHRKLLIAPLLAVNVHLHMIKPTCMFHTSLHSKSTQTIAVGGRYVAQFQSACPVSIYHSYDGLTDLFLPPDRITAPSVVGVSLAMTQLAHAVNTISESAKAVSSPERQLPTRRCDVYVVSFARGLEEVRLGVVADLWKHGIKADLVRSRKAALAH